MLSLINKIPKTLLIWIVQYSVTYEITHKGGKKMNEYETNSTQIAGKIKIVIVIK